MQEVTNTVYLLVTILRYKWGTSIWKFLIKPGIPPPCYIQYFKQKQNFTSELILKFRNIHFRCKILADGNLSVNDCFKIAKSLDETFFPTVISSIVRSNKGLG